MDTSEYGKYLYQAGSEDFYTYGDWFNICDNSPDGAGVIGYWKVGASGSEQSKYSGGGYDTCVTSDQDFVESSTIYIKVCISDDGVVIKEHLQFLAEGLRRRRGVNKRTGPPPGARGGPFSSSRWHRHAAPRGGS
ncbi:hypothetical protein ACRAWF_26490 [Streptomyces sp. L7]